PRIERTSMSKVKYLGFFNMKKKALSWKMTVSRTRAFSLFAQNCLTNIATTLASCQFPGTIFR
ncbi:hypothetical protein ACFL0S_02575, partial [Thermodesulfobacteriota bacterium]